MSLSYLRIIGCFLLSCLTCFSLHAQSQVDTSSNKIQVIHADVFQFERFGGRKFNIYRMMYWYDIKQPFFCVIQQS